MDRVVDMLNVLALFAVSDVSMGMTSRGRYSVPLKGTTLTKDSATVHINSLQSLGSHKRGAGCSTQT